MTLEAIKGTGVVWISRRLPRHPYQKPGFMHR
jgi:hypothetical protein